MSPSHRQSPDTPSRLASMIFRRFTDQSHAFSSSTSSDRFLIVTVCSPAREGMARSYQAFALNLIRAFARAKVSASDALHHSLPIWAWKSGLSGPDRSRSASVFRRRSDPFARSGSPRPQSPFTSAKYRPSEKQAFGYYVDGRVSVVVGTHTHAPTADHRILPGGTAFQSDAGMCGDYESILGMQKDEPIRRFLQKTPGARLESSTGEGALAGLAVETDSRTGLATRIAAVRIGPHLDESWPRFWD